MKRQPIDALTGIRFLAAVHVMVFHMAQKTIVSLPAGLSDFFGAGYVGVSMFFVLSGFILAYNYSGDNGGLTVSSTDFYIARIARIAPVYFFCMIFALPVFFSDMMLLGQGVAAAAVYTFGAIGMSGTLIQAWVPYPAFYLNSPGWSLSNEAFFYLLFPAIIFLVRSRSIAALVGIAIAGWLVAMAAPALYTIVTSDGHTIINHLTEGAGIAALKYNPMLRLPEFFIGALTGTIYLRRGPWEQKTSAILTPVLLVAVIGVLSISNRLPYIIIHNGLLAPLYAVFIFALAGDRGFIASFLSSKAMVLLGEASFSLYLFHLPFARYMHRFGGIIGVDVESLLYVIPVGIIAVACSIVLLKFVEEPARIVVRNRLKKMVQLRLRPQIAES
jgi:peptidoglycan/LPS O-acetylase OafA/YrhL